jgi:hypothetical protein
VKVRFQADADLNEAIVNGVLRREPSVDFLTAELGEVRGLPDHEVLALAAVSGRVVVSHDVGTMPAHFRDFRNTGRESAGLLISQSLDIGSAIEELLRIWAASDAEEWQNRMEWLPL